MDSIRVEEQGRLQREGKTQELRQVTVGSMALLPQHGLGASGMTSFDPGLSWLPRFAHMPMSVGLQETLNGMSVCCIAPLVCTHCWGAHEQCGCGRLESLL